MKKKQTKKQKQKKNNEVEVETMQTLTVKRLLQGSPSADQVLDARVEIVQQVLKKREKVLPFIKHRHSQT